MSGCLILKFLWLFVALVFFSAGGMAQSPAHHNRVIFFGLSTDEVDSLSGDESEVYSDFSAYTQQATPTLRKMSIEPEYLSIDTIRISYGKHKTLSVERKRMPFGFIFSDGVRKPLVVEHVLTADEIVKQARKYFRIK